MSYVKFMLQSLNRENGGFRFEPLVTDLLHATYARNIVPASGPVGPGERGEDSRTHQSYIFESSDLFRIHVSPPSSDKRIVFAYSIAVGWRAKAATDVEKILANNLPADKIVFVTNQVIPTRQRQDAEKGIGEEHKVELEILDGNWIAGYLEAEHYALAVKYLGCDRAVDPRIEEMIDRVLNLRSGGMTAEDAAEIERLERDVQYRAGYEDRQEHLVMDLMRLAEIQSQYLDHHENAVALRLRSPALHLRWRRAAAATPPAERPRQRRGLPRERLPPTVPRPASTNAA